MRRPAFPKELEYALAGSYTEWVRPGAYAALKRALAIRAWPGLRPADLGMPSPVPAAMLAEVVDALEAIERYVNTPRDQHGRE